MILIPDYITDDCWDDWEYQYCYELHDYFTRNELKHIMLEVAMFVMPKVVTIVIQGNSALVWFRTLGAAKKYMEIIKARYQSFFGRRLMFTDYDPFDYQDSILNVSCSGNN